ncbi:adenylate/guanylate cyclase domain-containing protein [Bradyrhizobium sp.]|uniref:adenylate/guanylate cyclase domain-containing protein n=1 Tax=Bradyrhizobium sp. TaxID=376 RepID=UPI003C7036FB
MTGNPTRRKIVAILASDVVGYSRLAAADEDRTLARLRALRSDLIDPTIAVHHGRVVKRTGDGALVEFSSVVDAVRCAIEVQNGMVERNAGVPPDRRIEFRIGIHLGDVVEENDGDLMGDGVNIAARLEGIAEPGGICLSVDAFRQVRDKIALEVFDLGDKKLKNIARPVHVYRIDVGAGRASSPAPDARKPTLALPDKPSIAVLAFENMSGDIEQDYFADGIAEDIITALARFRQFHVTARNSSFTYKGHAIDIKKIGRELGVRYVLEGSVRKAAERIRITAQLIDAESGNHVWADRYDGRLENIFDLQDEITNMIAAAVTPAFAIAEMQRVSRKHPQNLDAWELTLRAGQSFALAGPADIAEARELAQRALLLDRRNTAALAMLAFCHVSDGWWAYSQSPQASIAEGIKAARLALQEDNSDADALASLGYGLFAARQFDEGLDVLRQAVALNPNLANGFARYSSALAFCGDYEKAKEAFDSAIRLSPRDPRFGNWLAQVAIAPFIAGSYQEGIDYGRRAVQSNPSFMGAHRVLAGNLSASGQLEEAQREVAEMRRLVPGVTVTATRWLPFRDDEARERYCSALARAGLPE